jgi:hypothetical protein
MGILAVLELVWAVLACFGLFWGAKYGSSPLNTGVSSY